MGLTRTSVGASLRHGDDNGKRVADYTVAIAGNPNVGKSTVFNALTGLKQHTGNWPGKTVGCARGYFSLKSQAQEINLEAVDIPGTYSLLSHSQEEEIARDQLCFGNTDAVVIVCDAVCLERNLNLALQILEISRRAVVCVNLLDEATRKGIVIDTERLSERLGVPVVGTVARKKGGLAPLLEVLPKALTVAFSPCEIQYPSEIDAAASRLADVLAPLIGDLLPSRWCALRLLESASEGNTDDSLYASISTRIGIDLTVNEDLQKALSKELEELFSVGYTPQSIRDGIASAGILTAEQICREVCQVTEDKKRRLDGRDRTLDLLFTGKRTAYPIMLLLLALILWITVAGANYPSAWLSRILFFLVDRADGLLLTIGAPPWLRGLLVDGALRVTAWIVSVMLPPMAIFFPLFTLLEDAGYLPRVAFNLDKPFHRCKTCGKQALSMCMGFGCNAAGVVGCRIIDSPRERLIAILTNSFVPCNGRFPTLIAILTMFFAINTQGVAGSIVSAALLTLLIVLSVVITLLVSRLLSATVLRGLPSAFTLELPPYRRPQLGKVLIRSLLDRTIFVLGRAVVTAIPAGILIWLLANLQIGNVSLLARFSSFLDPLAQLMGLDGVILMAFLLGSPANEIVFPIMLMAYLSNGTLTDYGSLSELQEILLANGWDVTKALCTLLFALLHWPCITTLLTIRKESGSLKWTLLAALIPTLCGILLCMAVNSIHNLL